MMVLSQGAKHLCGVWVKVIDKGHCLACFPAGEDDVPWLCGQGAMHSL